MRLNRDWYPLIGALLIIGALYSHYLGHSVLLFEIILVGVGIAFSIVNPLSNFKKNKEEKNNGFLIRLLSPILNEDQCSVLIPIFGFIILLTWSVFKIFIIDENNLRMEDIIVSLLGLSIILYYSGPSRYYREKDFITLYLIFLTIVFAIVLNLYSRMAGTEYTIAMARSEYYIVTVPVVTILNGFGFDVCSEFVISSVEISNIIEYFYQGKLLRLSVGGSCSGIYSIGLFFSAFLAFVLIRYQKMSKDIAFAAIAGLFLTWSSNIIRMILTVIVGIEYGPIALITFHMYIGIIIFVAIILLFWIFIMKWLDKRIIVPSVNSEDAQEAQDIETDQ